MTFRAGNGTSPANHNYPATTYFLGARDGRRNLLGLIAIAVVAIVHQTLCVLQGIDGKC